MREFILIISKDELEPGFHFDPLDMDLESKICATSLKNAVQKLLWTKAFNEYINQWKSIWVYLKSSDGRIHYVPQYYDLEV